MEPSYQAKLFDAQRLFQRIICEQLHKLLTSGRSPQAAYNVLIQRITQGKGCHDVSESEIQRVSKTHELRVSHSKRALVVKGELRELKSKGMDTLEAVSKLIKRMQAASSAGLHVSTGKRAIHEVVANPHAALKMTKRRKNSKLSSSRPKRSLPRKQKQRTDEIIPDPDISLMKKPRR